MIEASANIESRDPRAFSLSLSYKSSQRSLLEQEQPNEKISALTNGEPVMSLGEVAFLSRRKSASEQKGTVYLATIVQSHPQLELLTRVTVTAPFYLVSCPCRRSNIVASKEKKRKKKTRVKTIRI